MIVTMPTASSIATAFLLVSGAALATQFRAGEFARFWPSADNSAVLGPANAPTNGWTTPALVGGGVSFTATTNAVPTPLWFGDAATGTVAYAALIVDCTATSAAWSTLLDSSTPLRLNAPMFAWQSPSFSTNGLSIAVDIFLGEALPVDGTRHLVEVAFPDPVPQVDLFLGGHPATPNWNRSWSGRVYEVILLPTRPVDADLMAVRAYLSLKWDVCLAISTPDDTRTRLRALGVKSDPLFSSILIMR